ncbi:MAG: hypothetical protein HOW97_20170 [Catenulispora sp.]|nr:hypothetical protein [Catenulispora sp.]
MANPEKKIISKLTSLTGHFHGIGEHTGGAVHGHGTHVHDAANKFDEEEKKLATEAKGKLGTEANKLEAQGEQEAAAASAAASSAARTRKPKLEKGSPEHRQDRWEKYQKKINDPKFQQEVADGKRRPPLTKEAWDNNYDVNMNKAKKAQQQVEDFADRAGHKKEDGWKFGNNQEEHTITFADGSQRRIDIANPDKQIGIEYKGGRINNQAEIHKELELDGRLVQEGWDIRWVGQTKEPPKWLKPHLDQHGIQWHHDDKSSPFHYRPKL